MRAVITVVGKDMIGILARVSTLCAENGVNIAEVSQTVLQDMFCMIMLVDTAKCKISLSEFTDLMNDEGAEHGLAIHVMREDIFDSMHKI
ncbi:MAG TPA: ACT domain-containing protein [Clostridiales bacterium]|nr:MAG: hypothetical protein BWY37_00184 [Firmicutes bacterium ADurb.Bin262]HOU11055.1 ACT domain-containing protein [Clostridiales bacterium]HQH63979.1 ACT domain-containing protein [Clostridiales bacterium]HQK73901.1 ACT domain-containing protein [Clostridiales bacterium]